MPTGYGIGYGSIGPNPWASANAAQYLGPGAQFQTLAGAPGSAGQYWSSIRPPSTYITRNPKTPPRVRAIPSPLPPSSSPSWGIASTPQYGLKPPSREPCGPGVPRSMSGLCFPDIYSTRKPAPSSNPWGIVSTPQYGLKPPPKRTYQQPRNPVVPAGDSAPYNGSEAPVAAPSKGGTLRIGGMNVWSGPNKPTTPVARITVPQDATQTRQQVNGGRKQIKLPEPEAIAAIGGAGLLLVLL